MIKKAFALALLMTLGASASAQQQRAQDGVTINDEGNPVYSTFSLCAIDPTTGQSGASVTTRVPFVGRAVPHVRAGVGAVCTQASTMVEYGPRGLDLMAKGIEPSVAIPLVTVALPPFSPTRFARGTLFSGCVRGSRCPRSAGFELNMSTYESRWMVLIPAK